MCCSITHYAERRLSASVGLDTANSRLPTPQFVNRYKSCQAMAGRSCQIFGISCMCRRIYTLLYTVGSLWSLQIASRHPEPLNLCHCLLSPSPLSMALTGSAATRHTSKTRPDVMVSSCLIRHETCVLLRGGFSWSIADCSISVLSSVGSDRTRCRIASATSDLGPPGRTGCVRYSWLLHKYCDLSTCYRSIWTVLLAT